MQPQPEVDWRALARTAELELQRPLELPDAAPGFADWQHVSVLVAAVAQVSGARIVAVSGSQGSGKSSLAQCLKDTLRKTGRQAAAVSLDDFYLTRQERQQLAQQVHPLLQTRGVPGTHDWQWLHEVVQAVQSERKSPAQLTLPKFDKGTDDRAGSYQVEADLLVLEGWCLGIHAQAEAALERPCNTLERTEDKQGLWRRWVNQQIHAHYEDLWTSVDLWIHLRVPGFAQVHAWRTQQEQQLPVDQRMSEAQISRFIAHYERLTQALWQQTPARPGWVLQLNENHQVTQVTAALKAAK